jgi:hypothetical protein
VAGVGDRLHLLGEGLDRVRRDEPGGLDAEALEQAQQARRADLAREHAARDVARTVFAAVRTQPAGDRVDIDAVGAQDFLCHDASPHFALSCASRLPRRHVGDATRAAPDRKWVMPAQSAASPVFAQAGRQLLSRGPLIDARRH